MFGMELTFAAIGNLAAVGGSLAVQLNSYGRILAIALLTVTGIALISETASVFLTRPFVAFGNRITSFTPNGAKSETVQSVFLGIATGFLWAPCAGPILGLILTGAIINGPGIHTTELLLSYAVGAVVSLAVAAYAGGRILAAFKRSLGLGEWVRRVLGIGVLAAVGAIVLGWDTGILTAISAGNTTRFEQSILDAFGDGSSVSNEGAARAEGASGAGGAMTGPAMQDKAMNGAMTGGAMMMSSHAGSGEPEIEGNMPPLSGATAWLNSAPLAAHELLGKVVVVDFWTYSCINCLRTLPYTKSWYEHYKSNGLVVVGVHTPEFAFEKNESNVKRSIRDLGVTYPVALDNNFAIWKEFNNRFWPAHYFVDAQGRIRGHHFGEGEYDESEQLIRKLLAEAGTGTLPPPITSIRDEGVEAAADEKQIESPETYIGYDRARHFASQEAVAPNKTVKYSFSPTLNLNDWGLSGEWNVRSEEARLEKPGGTIWFRFHARDLHLVLGTAVDGKPIRFRVTIDGKAPGASHGSDIDSDGQGVVREQRLYQLLRQSGDIRDRTFSIEFEDAGVDAYSFTFG